MATRADEEIWAVPAKSVSFDVKPPFTIEGMVTGQEIAQQVDIKTREPLTWEDGRPRKKVILTMQTTLSEDDEDDGKRQVHIKVPSALFAAVRDAMKDARTRTPIGHHLAITYTGDGEPAGKGLNPPKEFAVLIEDETDDQESGDTSEPPF